MAAPAVTPASTQHGKRLPHATGLQPRRAPARRGGSAARPPPAARTAAAPAAQSRARQVPRAAGCSRASVVRADLKSLMRRTRAPAAAADRGRADHQRARAHSDPAGFRNRPSQTQARTAAGAPPLPSASAPAARDPARTGSAVLCCRLDIRTGFRTAPYWARSRLNAVLISARWVSAWGKFPCCWPVRLTSAYRPRWLG
jgi:hypothetical protein